MELDELKKSWNALDERLKKDHIITEDSMNKLINEHKLTADSSRNKLLRYDRRILVLGIIILPLLFLNIFLSRKDSPDFLTIYFIVILAFAILWDVCMYCYLKRTNILEMPLVTVVRRITRFHQLFIWECYGCAVLFLSIPLIQAYHNDLIHQALWSQALFVLVWIGGGWFAYWVVKRFFYDKVRIIKKNVAELQELKQK